MEYKRRCPICTIKFKTTINRKKCCSKKCADRNWINNHTKQSYESNKKWRKAHPELMKLYNKTYFKKHPEAKVRHIRNHNRKWRENPIKHVIQNLRKHNTHRFEQLRAKKTIRHSELIGCDNDTFKKHIESKFKPGMTWENYGKNGWVADHIKRLCEFDLSNIEEQKKAFNYKNLQPMWNSEHEKKTAVENKQWRGRK